MRNSSLMAAVSVALGAGLLFMALPGRASAECRVLSTDPTYAAGQLKDLTCGTNGTLQVGGGPASATEAAPAFTEGSSGSLSFDLLGNLRVTKGRQDGGEHIGATEGEGYQRVTPGVPLATTAGTAITTNTTSAVYKLPAGAKTPLAKITAAGAQTQTFTIYGAYDTTAANGISLCVITLSVAVKDVKTCDSGSQITKDFPYYYHVTSLTTGSASGELIYYNGLVAGGDASAANQTTMITHLANIAAQTAYVDNSIETEDLGETLNGGLSMVGTVRRDTAASSAGTTGDNATLNTNSLGAVWTQLSAGPTSGATTLSYISAGATEDKHAVCTAACTLYSISVTNTNAAVRYLKCENDTSAGTAPGTDTPELRLAIPVATTGGGNNPSIPAVGMAFSTGLTCWLVTGAADSDVAEVAANEIMVNYGFKQ